mgnify:CR=1 FL=1|jgi:hypothetical protein
MINRLQRNRKHVFIDWSLVEAGSGNSWVGTPDPWLMPYGIELRTFAPTVHAEPVLLPEMPWEAFSISAWATVFEDQGVFRLYYEGYHTPDADGQNIRKYVSQVCYAESEDGVNWVRPKLGIIDFRGDRDTNIVFSGLQSEGIGPHGATVIRDENGTDEARYKMIFGTVNEEKRTRHLRGATSPDGFNWTAIPDPLIYHACDTQSVLAWDADEGFYRIYTRGYRNQSELSEGRHVWPERRTIDHARSKDFYTWEKPMPCLVTDPMDPPTWDLYSSSYTRWPGAQDAHLMFPNLFKRDTEEMETSLAVSRDGNIWQRPIRDALIPSGPPDSETYGGNITSQGLIQSKPGEWTQLLQVKPISHNERAHNPDGNWRGGLWRATIREDGYMAVEAEARGAFWTVTFEFEGRMLATNSWTHFGGWVRIGITDEAGTPIEGYGVEDCDRISGDTMWDAVSWNGKSDLSAFAGRPIRLQFEMVRARIYAFKFGDDL